ncbi:MAG: U32 family peptidase [Planctomycetaceae bacterium]|jgi:putative protease|nr:U32 family peptidase [Planctomycetaceae bacterium]
MQNFIPELLSPAGDLESLHAAVENGADAVYFGIGGIEKHNARIRATNIPLNQLDNTMQLLHARGMRGYVTLNTLIRGDEFVEVEQLLRAISAAGVDAVIVQDVGLALLSRRICPNLDIHASTQMSLTSPRAVEFARLFGIRRVILPRELSIEQVGAMCCSVPVGGGEAVEVEAFIHGALCISFSGQCYASLSLGGRSANRGCCAQPCRIPYELIGEGGVKNHSQLLSPSDLAAMPVLEKLVDTGVHSLKIEGRLKPPEYVAVVTRAYREALDMIGQKKAQQKKDNLSLPQKNHNPKNHNHDNPKDRSNNIVGNTVNNLTPKSNTSTINPRNKNTNSFDQHQPDKNQHDELKIDLLSEYDMSDLELIFSRGLTTGWLGVVEPSELVSGNILSHRGIEVGEVVEVRRDAVVARLSKKVQRGDGLLFENKEFPDKSQGGRVYEIFRKGISVQKCDDKIKVLLTFANNSIDPQFVERGQSIRKTNDPEFEREIRKSLESKNTRRRIPINVSINAVVGHPLKLTAVNSLGAKCEIYADGNLEQARKHPATIELLREQFDRLGGTIFSLANLEANIEGEPMIPLSLLGKLRHEMIEQLENVAQNPKAKPKLKDDNDICVTLEDVLSDCRESFGRIVSGAGNISGQDSSAADVGLIHILLRDVGIFEDERFLSRLISDGCRSFYGEFCNIEQYKKAASIVRHQGGKFTAVLPRVILPDEAGLLREFLELRPDAVLARNVEEIMFFREKNIPVIADFSLNIINQLSFQKILNLGVERITPGFDLGQEQIEQFCNTIPPQQVEMILLGRIPLFTMNHCIWRANVVPRGKPCEKICQKFPLKIRDRRGAIHSVRTDILCKNIIENAAEYTTKPIKGINHYRIEWDKRLGNLENIIQNIKQEIKITNS